MRSEWEQKKLGDFCAFQHGKGLPARYRKFGLIPVISSAGIIGNHRESLVKTAGIIIGRKGNIGSITFSPNPFWPIDTAFYIEDKPKIRDIRFTYYLLKTLGLEHMNSHTAVPGLNRENVHAISVSIPKLSEQIRIANALSVLDDQITLLRETSKTLESIAQTLFKSWFINFDPVHAKQQGRTPDGMDAETAEKIKNCQIQIQTLEKLRDTLLPRLISGQLRIEEVNLS